MKINAGSKHEESFKNGPKYDRRCRSNVGSAREYREHSDSHTSKRNFAKTWRMMAPKPLGLVAFAFKFAVTYRLKDGEHRRRRKTQKDVSSQLFENMAERDMQNKKIFAIRCLATIYWN